MPLDFTKRDNRPKQRSGRIFLSLSLIAMGLAIPSLVRATDNLTTDASVVIAPADNALTVTTASR
ncbi:MAG: hypothetical protein AAF408_19465 [Pseudomonadota bacterium]